MTTRILEQISDTDFHIMVAPLPNDERNKIHLLRNKGELVIGRYSPDQLSADNAEQFLTSIFRGIAHYESNGTHFSSLHGVFEVKAQNNTRLFKENGTPVKLSEIRGIGSTKKRSTFSLLHKLLAIGTDNTRRIIKHIPKSEDQHTPTQGTLYETVIDTGSPHHDHKNPHLLDFNTLIGLGNDHTVKFSTSETLIDGLHTHLIPSHSPSSKLT